MHSPGHLILWYLLGEGDRDFSYATVVEQEAE